MKTSNTGYQSQEGHVPLSILSMMFNEHTDLRTLQSYVTFCSSPVRHLDFDGYISRHQAPECFPPKMTKDNPQHIILATPSPTVNSIK